MIIMRFAPHDPEILRALVEFSDVTCHIWLSVALGAFPRRS
jgi:hypothetical protein